MDAMGKTIMGAGRILVGIGLLLQWNHIIDRWLHNLIPEWLHDLSVRF